MKTLDEFFDRLDSFGESDAIVFAGDTCSYRELMGLVEDWRAFLDANDMRSGQVVTLEGPYSPDVCAGLLALIARGAIIVPMASLPATKRGEYLEVAEVEVTIESRSGQRRCERTGVTAEHDLFRELRERDVPGLVLFSSGTTGRSKASVLDFAKVVTRYGPPKQAQRILSFLNLDHIGGINTLLHTLSNGGAVITVHDRTPDAVFDTIATHAVEILPTTPTFLNMMLIARAQERYSTASLQMITYGTEPMPLHTLQRLKQVLPHVRLKQTYGLSELGILPTRSRGNESLWVKLGDAGFEHKIIDGILWIRSEMAMLGYLNAPAPFDEDGFFNTQDAVETDGEWVRILGRRSEILNIGGDKVYPSEIETVLLEIPNIAEATVSGKSNPVTGTVVTATVQLVEPEDPRTMSRRVRAYCVERLEAFKVPMTVKVADAAQHSDRFKKIRAAT